jgi:hypothetical protein
MKRIEFEPGEKISGTYWTVIEEAPSKNGERYYKCRCICGKVKEVNVKNLKYGKSKSCGCVAAKRLSKKYKGVVKKENDIDLTNKIFNKIKVVKRISGKGVQTIWECECLNCGKIFNKTQHNLASGRCVSCGCAKRENSKKNINKYLGQVEKTNLSTINSDKPGKANTSGVKGVSYRKTTNNYVAYIGFKGKLNIIGYFKTLEEAAAARKQAEEKLYKPILEKYNYKSNKEN